MRSRRCRPTAGDGTSRSRNTKAPRVMSSRARVISSAPAFLVLAFLYGCGGSSSINVVQPSSGKCGIAVSNSMPRVPADGGRGNLTVETNRECSWSARAEAPWISLSGSEGQGPATVAYTVTANGNGTPRQSAVVVGEQRVAVTQDAAPCRFTVSPSSGEADAGGGQISVSVTAPGGCAWSARSDASWIGTASGSSGEGNGSVLFNVSANAGPPRTGAVVVAGVTVQIAQGSITQPAPQPTPAPVPTPTPAPTPSPSPHPLPHRHRHRRPPRSGASPCADTGADASPRRRRRRRIRPRPRAVMVYRQHGGRSRHPANP